MKYRYIILIFCILYFVQMQVSAQLRERVYMQTDKQLYLAGELLWLKLYTTDIDGKLMSFSKIGYIELIRDSIPELQVKIDIRDGTGVGWLELPAMLPTGYYRMVAYTRYMRNENENVFFEKIICIVNPFNQNEKLDAGEANMPFLLEPIETGRQAVELYTNKPSYTKRNKGEIRIKGLPAENIALGISIAGANPALATNATVSDWKKQLSGNTSPFVSERFLPEYEGAIIDGVLIDLHTGNPAADQEVTNLLSFPGNEIQLFAGEAGEKGNIAFYTQCVTGKKELTTTSIDPSGRQFRVDILSPYQAHTPAELPAFNPDSTWIDYLQDRNLAVQVTHAYTADSLSNTKDIMPCSYYRPYIRYILDDYTRFPNMEEIFIEFIAHANIRRTNEGRRFSMMTESFDNYTNNILVLLDNIPISDHELLCDYNPLLIKTIDLHIGRYVFGGHLFDGIISFYSYNYDFPGITFGKNTQLFDYEGAQPYRYFYAPRYDETNVSSRMPDFRHTLLWEPDIQSNGQAELIIPFTTSDMPGKYVVTIEGIGVNGTILNVKMEIEVE